MSPVADDRTERVAVLTGASGGMGQVIATQLLRTGLRVVAVVRDPRRLAPLVADAGPDARQRLEIVEADLSARSGVVAAARAVSDRFDQVHLLVNNAGAHFPGHRLSADGIELHIAVDYLAAFGLMTLLDRPLRRGRARVVNVASDSLNDTRPVKLVGPARPATLDLRGVESLAQLSPADGFTPFAAYARAKLMTVTAGYALARALAADGVTVNALHPGIVATPIIDDLVPRPLRPFGRLIRSRMLTPAEGAAAAVRLATDPALDGVTGRYYDRARETTTPPVSYDREVQRRLVALSAAHYAL